MLIMITKRLQMSIGFDGLRGGRLLVLLFVLLPFVSAYAVEVSGDCWGFWTADNNPYNVVGDIRVPRESTLVIGAGCYINFTGRYRFIIDSSATLLALGGESDSIYFLPQDTVRGWGGLRFINADTSYLSYCVLRWGKVYRSDYPYSKGGAIFLANSCLRIENSNLSNNQAFEGEGGAIYSRGLTLSVHDCVMRDNYCGFGGAAIHCWRTRVVIENSEFMRDSTFSPLGFGNGGAITIYDCSSATIVGNTIKGNFGVLGGGILVTVHSNAFQVTLVSNVISYNRALFSGGGVALLGSTANLCGNLIYSNSAGSSSSSGEGGGIFCAGSYLTMVNNTVTNNQVTPRGEGGGVYCEMGRSELRNNIIWNNVAGYIGNQIYQCLDTTVFIGYNDIQDTVWPGEGNISLDPLFADTAAGNYNLTWVNYPIEDSSKSPCIDTGDPSCPPDSDGTRADMGALFFDRRRLGIVDEPMPVDYLLLGSYPNPFNEVVTIRYRNLRAGPVRLVVYNLAGQEVAALVDGFRPVGEARVVWEAYGFPSGIYFVCLTTLSGSRAARMVMVK